MLHHRAPTPKIRSASALAAISALILTPITCPSATFAESPPPTLGIESNPLWLRYPSISPAGSTIAFSFRGHILTVPATGGLATALTAGPAHDSSPVWSPDGKLIAFASDRYGHDDVYVVSSLGGPARRLTTYSTNSVPTSFTPDSQYVLFTQHRIGSVQSSIFPERIFPQLYKVSIQGRREPEMILTTPALYAKYDQTQSRILYEDVKEYEDPWRKHETFSIAHDIWIYDVKTRC